MPRKSRSAEGELHVQGEMTIYRAGELGQQVLATVRECAGTVRVNLSDVTEFDTAGLQILLMARRLAAAGGKRLDIVKPSACVEEVLELCNLTEAFGAAGESP